MTRNPRPHLARTTTEFFGTVGKARVSSRALASLEAIARRISATPPRTEFVPLRR